MKPNQSLLRQHFAKYYQEYTQKAQLQKTLARELVNELEVLGLPTPRRALEIGFGTGFLSLPLLEKYPQTQWILNDIVPESRAFIPQLSPSSPSSEPNPSFLHGDIESLDLPLNLDLVASSSALQWLKNLPEFLTRLTITMRPNGILALSLFGKDNLKEIQQLLGIGLDYTSLPALTQHLETLGYKILHQHERHETLHFPNPLAVLHHLRETGVNSITPFRFTKNSLRQFEADYHKHYPQITLSYHPLRLIAQKVM